MGPDLQILSQTVIGHLLTLAEHCRRHLQHLHRRQSLHGPHDLLPPEPLTKGMHAQWLCRSTAEPQLVQLPQFRHRRHNTLIWHWLANACVRGAGVPGVNFAASASLSERRPKTLGTAVWGKAESRASRVAPPAVRVQVAWSKAAERMWGCRADPRGAGLEEGVHGGGGEAGGEDPVERFGAEGGAVCVGC